MEPWSLEWVLAVLVVPISIGICTIYFPIRYSRKRKEKMKEIPLTLPNVPAGVKFVGREMDLRRFADLLWEGTKIAVVSGIGGVGKTEFAKAFFAKHRGSYPHVGWVEYKNNFKDTLVDTPGLMEKFEAPADQRDARYGEILKLLRELPKKVVLIFDNVSNAENDAEMQNILALKCRVIFTTRESFEAQAHLKDLSIYSMEFMPVKDCIKLFARYRGKAIHKTERADAEKIVELAGRHTLALELLAAIYKEAGYQSAKELLDRLADENFDLKGLSEEVQKSGGATSERLLKQMATLYRMSDIEKLGDEAVGLLTNLCILPLKNFPVKVLLHWLELSGINLLNKLADKRLIRFVDGKKMVEMHDVIAEVLRQELKPDSEKCGRLIETVTTRTALSNQA